MIGQTLGHYRIVEKIGAGGMGEVYRATDTKLNREVALKVVPGEFARDADRMARFRREAQVLASLNHPNIASIYGLEEDKGTRALVLELVEGPTLAERIKEGALPLDDALNIARQMAEALEAAHEQGIIHRDLKPANVKIKEDGLVKVLDFGLAKALEDPYPEEDIANSPTLSVAATKAGIILGTAAYMSPEQAKGKEANRRADIWAFGVVVFEMLTGRRLYGGETVSETLAAVIKDEPPWDFLPEETPAQIRKLLRRCLVKDPRQRLQAIGEARIAIADYLANPTDASVVMSAPAVAPAPAWQRFLPWAAAGTLAVALVLVLWSPWAVAPEPPPPMRLSVEVAPTEPYRASVRPNVALSPDGTHLAYVAGSGGNHKLYLRPLDQLQGSALSGTEGAYTPFFSPDGQWVAFFADGKLKKVSVSGGAVVTLCDVDSVSARGGTWAPDDTIIFTPGTTVGMSRVPAAGGTPEPVSTTDQEKKERSHRWPQVLPGGRVVLFTSQLETTTFDEASIEVLFLETGERKVLHRGGHFARYLPTGHLVFVHQGNLFAAPMDLKRMELTGPPAPILEEVVSHTGSGASQLAFSQEGTLVYLPGRQSGGDTEVVWVDREGKTQPLLDSPKIYLSLRLSPHATRLVTRIVSGAGSHDLWVYELGRGTLSRLTFDPVPDMRPVWTPDGARVTFASGRHGGNPNIYWKRADGTGEAERLTDSANAQHPTSWSPDGKILAFYETDARGNLDIWTLRLEGEKKPELFLGTPFAEVYPMYSPDGRWLAYQSDESGRQEIYVRPFPGPGSKWQISTEGGREPLWARTGRELFYHWGDKVMVVPYRVEGDAFRAATPRVLFEGQFAQRGYNPAYDVTADGKRFVMLKQVGASGEEVDRSKLTFVLNWFEEIHRRVPTD